MFSFIVCDEVTAARYVRCTNVTTLYKAAYDGLPGVAGPKPPTQVGPTRRDVFRRIKGPGVIFSVGPKFQT